MNNSSILKPSHRSIIYLTTPLYYMNGKPHLGHACSTLYGDFFKRFHRCFTKTTVILMGGFDQYGKKISDQAKLQNLTPKEFVTENTNHFQTLWTQLNVNFDDDYLVQTTNSKHHQFVNQAFAKLNHQGDLYLADYQGWYCSICENFLREKNNLLTLESGNFCRICRQPAQFITEKNYFLKITATDRKWLLTQFETWKTNFWTKLQYEISDHIAANTAYQKYVTSLINPLITWIKTAKSLDFAVTRYQLPWAITIDNTENQTAYVWFDALLGYLSQLSSQTVQRFFGFNQSPEQSGTIYQILGKEITKFHAVYWPILLKKLGYRVPDGLLIHGWLLNRTEKMSKSLRNVVTPEELATTLTHHHRWEVVRLFLANLMTPYDDINFSRSDFQTFYRSHLVNNLSNYCYRLLKLIIKGQSKANHHFSQWSLNEDYDRETDFYQEFVKKINHKLTQYFTNGYRFGFAASVKNIFELLDWGNKTINQLQLWTLITSDSKKFYFWSQKLVRLIYLVSHLLRPFAPDLAQELLEMINEQKFLSFSESNSVITWDTFQYQINSPFLNNKVVKLFT